MRSEASVRLQRHLDRVSRSFAACIAELKEPLRHWVGLAYALCRLVDTVEDAPWDNPGARTEALERFCELISHEQGIGAAQISAWCRLLPHAIDPGERALVDDTLWLTCELNRLPPAPRAAIVETVRRMATGMRHYASRWQSGGELRLYDGVDVNRYCYFVAGVVGDLLFRLFRLSEPSFEASPHHLTDAHHFGLFLQKVNLLKDQRIDETQQRFLVPERTGVLASLEQHARRALAYILALPHHAAHYRAFCAFSLLLGARSLPLIATEDAAVDVDARLKLPRQETEALFSVIRSIASDDIALEENFEAAWTQLAPLLRNSKREVRANAPLTDGDWFEALVAPQLTLSQQQHLGLV